MLYDPLDYEQINSIVGRVKPSTSKYANTYAYQMWFRALYQRAISRIEIDLPFDEAIKNAIIYWLYRDGYVACINSDKYGFMMQPCTLSGYTVYYLPAKFIITNPYDTNISKEFTIGIDGEIMKLTPDYRGIFDIVDYYAAKLAGISEAIDISIDVNTTPNILGAKDKGAAEAIKKVFTKVSSGESLVVFDKAISTDDDDPFISLYREHVKDSYITDMQLRDFQTLLNNFDCEIGIPALPTEKKERMISDEANSRIADSSARSGIWLDTLKGSIKKVNEHFGTSISAKFKEVETYGNNDTIRNPEISTAE